MNKKINLIIIIFFLVLKSDHSISDTNFTPDTYKQLELFSNAFERIRKDYVENVTDKDLIESAINGMLTSLDPHSSFLSADSFDNMKEQTKGEFGGLGIEVTMENGFVKVISPIDDTPAFRAGIKTNDYITAINGETVLGLSLNEAVEMMRGPKDTDITITIRREGEESFDVTITRAIIKIRSVKHRIERKVGYIRITSFNEQTQKGLEEAIMQINNELNNKAIGFILDLRNNPGGLLDTAISVTDTFLNRGEIVSTRSREENEIDRKSAKDKDLINGLPVVILINDGSASASEIVAGALQDHGRAIILGTKSFGKGSVQTIIPMRDNNAMRLTTARYYTPSGKSIQGTGIIPDIVVEPSKIERLGNNLKKRSEANLRGALGNDTLDEDKNDNNEIRNTIDLNDYQLSRALDLIEGLSIYNKNQIN